MQQTDKYKLNLLETSDAFSPNPLNENAQKTEAALTAVTAHADAGDAALDQRLQILEAHHIVVGSYKGNCVIDKEGTQDILLGFTPKLVIVIHVDPYLVIKDAYSTKGALAIIEGGFRAINKTGYKLNYELLTYKFFAIG